MIDIGVIAEEQNDIDSLFQITRRMLPERSFRFSSFAAHGCGKLRRKCAVWAKVLLERRCKILVVLHDLDRNVESTLRSSIESSIATIGFELSIVVIPIEELEAWLLSDAAALKRTFKMQKLPKTPSSPEAVNDPKEHLEDLVNRNSKTKYLNTIHNAKIAAEVDVKVLHSKCKSFVPYPKALKKKFKSVKV